DVASLGVDLMSFTAHKIYGPKGIGALYVRRGSHRLRLEPLLTGGGQEMGLRSGTLNVAGCVGFGRAIELCQAGLPQEAQRIGHLRDRLYEGLTRSVQNISLNGPLLGGKAGRLPGNLNMCFPGVDGESLMMSMGYLAVSSGSACTSSEPEPSHVLRALGCDDDATRSSLRFSLGRFNTGEEVDFAIGAVSDAVQRLRTLGS
ncbi:MAG: IscS subfamily cysteine desulfurase, partial [Planctomycetaceae bacterium]|nr:IscS subfamily cysteine desulfurase [Planctomycetaceae bacterium]